MKMVPLTLHLSDREGKRVASNLCRRLNGNENMLRVLNQEYPRQIAGRVQ
jgi:hypothetical protein